MSIKAFEIFGSVELKNKASAELKKVDRDVDSTTRHFRTLGRELDHVSSKGRGLSSSFSGLGSFLSRTGANAAGNLLSSGLSAVTGGIQAEIEKGREYNRTLEQSLIGFETLLGSKAAAIQHIKELETFAFKTPFTSSELFKLSPMLQGVGFAAKDVIPVLTSVGNALAATGNSDSLERVIRQLGQMQAKGRVSFEEMNVLAENGIPAWRMLAEAIARPGENIDELQAKMMHLGETGNLMSKDVMPVLFAQFDKKYGGAMERVALTTQFGVKSGEEDTRQRIAGEGLRGTTEFDFTGGAYGSETERSRKRTIALQGARGDQLRGTIGNFGSKYGSATDYIQEEMLSPMAGRDQFFKFFGKLTDGTLGSDIVGPMVQQLKNGASAVGGAAASFGKSIYDGLNSIWDWGSPSKTAIQLGQWINQGMEIGLGEKGANYEALLNGVGAMRGGGIGGSQRQYLEQVGQNPTVRAFFEAIKKAEGGSENVIVGGRRFSDLSDHPNVVGLRTAKGPSTAAGSWQITGSNWFGNKRKGTPGLKEQLGLTDFTENSQYLAALKLFADREGGAGIRALLSGDIETAMRIAAKDWTSTPGSTIGGGSQLSKSRWMGHFNSALGSGSSGPSAPISASNPMPVQIVDFGNGVDFRSGPNMAGAGRFLSPTDFPAAMLLNNAQRRGSKTINDPFPVDGGSIYSGMRPIEHSSMNLAQFINEKPLQALLKLSDAAEGAATNVGGLDQAAKLRAQVDAADEKGSKKKKDKLFDSQFTREGAAGDFQSGFAGLLGNLGWESPKSLGKQFLFNFARDMQGRLANDLSSMLTGKLFGGRGEDGKLSGGILSKLFGGLFGGGRASGGGMSAGRFYMAGENGPELISGPGYVHNNRETKQMMGGGENRTIVYFGPNELGRGVADFGMTSRGRRMRLIQAKWGRKLQMVNYG